MTTDKRKALVADEDRVLSETLAMILNQSGYTAKSAKGGEAAVALAEEFLPDIFISQLNMIEMNGIDAALAIRRVCPSLRVILYSTYMPPSDIVSKAYGQNFSHLAMPFDIPTLLQMLEKSQSD